MTDHRTTVASYAASGAAVFFGMTANELGALVGAVCAVGTLAVNAWFKWQQLKLARQAAADGHLQIGGDNG